MRIEVYEQPTGDKAGREVWVRVLANEAHDWPSIEKKLRPEHRALLNSLGARTMRFYPFTPEGAESPDEGHDYLYEDFWVWEKA